MRSKFVICFDEAFNEIKKDYFVGHSTAEDIMENFFEASSKMEMMNHLQVLMDGPSVNWSFLEKLESFRWNHEVKILVWQLSQCLSSRQKTLT